MSNLMVHTERFTRSRDPETSWDAASVITAEGWTTLMASIVLIVASARRPITRDEIVTAYTAASAELRLPRVTPQRVRTAVKSLLLGERVDFRHAQKCTRALRVADSDGRSAAGNRAERLEVTR